MEDIPVGSSMQLRTLQKDLEERPSHTQRLYRQTLHRSVLDRRCHCRLIHAAEGPFRRSLKKGLFPYRGCTDRLYTGQCRIEDATVGLTHASEGLFRRTWKKGLRPHRDCTDRLYTGQCWMEVASVGSPMQLTDPSEGIGRKAFAHTEAVHTDSTQVRAGWRFSL